MTEREATKMNVMQVAARLRKRYQAARDLMLTGKLGEAIYEGRSLFVESEAVERYAREQGL